MLHPGGEVWFRDERAAKFSFRWTGYSWRQFEPMGGADRGSPLLPNAGLFGKRARTDRGGDFAMMALAAGKAPVGGDGRAQEILGVNPSDLPFTDI
jgi:hypothetical protein